MLGIIITVAIIWGVINLLAFARRRVDHIQDEIFDASYHSLEQAHRQSLISPNDQDFTKQASKIVGFFGEQAYGRKEKIPQSMYNAVKHKTRELQNNSIKEKKIGHI